MSQPKTIEACENVFEACENAFDALSSFQKCVFVNDRLKDASCSALGQEAYARLCSHLVIVKPAGVNQTVGLRKSLEETVKYLNPYQRTLFIDSKLEYACNEILCKEITHRICEPTKDEIENEY